MSDNLFGLWPHQERAVGELEASLAAGISSICLQMPTGAGKTRIIRTIVDNRVMSKKVIYVVAHRSILITQLSAELTDAGIKHGIIQAGYPYVRYRVQVCSIGTLIRRVGKIPSPELIIVDEVHHLMAGSYHNLISSYSEAKIIGVTATPQRTDGKALKDVFEKLIIGPSTASLIKDGYLCDYEYYAPESINTSKLHVRRGEFEKKETLKLVDRKKIIGSVVKHYEKYASHKSAIACCVSIAHAEHVCSQFISAGYKARAVHSKMEKQVIKESIEGLKNKSLEILCQCDLLGEGVDIKGAEALIMLRPTASIVVFLQQIGRVLRIHEGKTHATIIDHVGNWERHGLPDTPREWSLSGAIKQPEAAALKRCPECLMPVAIAVRACPHCGFLFAATEETAGRIPEETAGKLVSIKNISRNEKNDVIIQIARNARTLKQAVAIAKKLGVDHRGAWYIWTHDLKNSA